MLNMYDIFMNLKHEISAFEILLESNRVNFIAFYCQIAFWDYYKQIF